MQQIGGREVDEGVGQGTDFTVGVEPKVLEGLMGVVELAFVEERDALGEALVLGPMLEAVDCGQRPPNQAGSSSARSMLSPLDST